MTDISYERTADGRLLAWVFPSADPSGDRNLLRRCSECLVSDLGAQPTERFDAMDQIFLDFTVAGAAVLLQWTQGRGIAVGSAATGQMLVERIAAHLAVHVRP